MLQANKRFYTAEDYWNVPEQQRAELIGGQLYNMAPPGFLHQKLVSELHHALMSYVKSRKGKCEVIPDPFAVNLTANDETWVEPDISVICDRAKLSDRGCEGAPDFILEVVSPSSRQMDYRIKMNLYSNAGVREYWIVDPMKKRTTVYFFEEDIAPVVFPFEQNIVVGIYGDFSICVAELLERE